MVTSPAPSSTHSDRATEFAERGWRTVIETEPDGTIEFIHIPLTPEKFLHPQEGFRFPNSTFHEDTVSYAQSFLKRRYANDPKVGVFRDLLIGWDIEGQKDHCPDTFVAFGIKNKDRNRSKFIVTDEGVRPRFILEVVSPRYRKEDREKKVIEYARTKVQEYVIVDRRRQRGKLIDEVLGYTLVEGIYQPITPDEEGRILCKTLGVRMSLQEGQLVIEDAKTGERLLSSLELEAAKKLAEQQAAEMAALLEKYRERFGELPEQGES